VTDLFECDAECAGSIKEYDFRDRSTTFSFCRKSAVLRSLSVKNICD
jgi:hypothetical protein